MTVTVDPLAARLWFESLDADSSGLLDAKELRQALNIGGLDYSIAQAHLFVRAFDSKGNNKLNINDFVELYSFLNTLQTNFARVSRGRQHLTRVEVPEALAFMGLTLDGTVLQSVLTRHDTEGRGLFGVETFMHMCLFLHTSVRIFHRFDPSSSGEMNLSFNQFCYAAAHLA